MSKSLIHIVLFTKKRQTTDLESKSAGERCVRARLLTTSAIYLDHNRKTPSLSRVRTMGRVYLLCSECSGLYPTLITENAIKI